MEYEQALDKIHSLLTFGSRPGLDRMCKLLDLMGNPQNNLKFFHIAGTNGKGSVCEMLSSVLECAGYKTGLFISPYITDFRERIQINNKIISKKQLAEAVEATYPLIEKLYAQGTVITEFEYVNALEFYIHAKEKCDVVVLETGMGGLLDCTNVIKSPLCSVITTIGLDHTAILGDTIQKIAVQKCGIIKSDSAVIFSKQQPCVADIIQKTAESLNIPFICSDQIKINVKYQTLEKSVFEYNNQTIPLHLAGGHQIENVKTALAALEYVRQKGLLTINDSCIKNGIEKAVNPARLETLCKKPVVLLDGAHNPNGIMSLVNAAEQFLHEKKIIGIIGMLADKDSEGSLKLLENTFDVVFTVPVNNPRALSSQQLAEKCKKHFNSVTEYNNVFEAFDTAFKKAKANDYAVIVCGSLYLAGEIRPYIIQSVG